MTTLLQPGDILAWRITPEAKWFDRLIGWGERRIGEVNSQTVNYYHVGIVGVDPLHFYDSQPGGVDNRDLPKPLPDNVEVYRFKEPLTPDELLKMWTYANSQKGRGYNYLGVLTAGLVQVFGKPFCSELVWRIGTYAARFICPWQTCLSPDDIVASLYLTRII